MQGRGPGQQLIPEKNTVTYGALVRSNWQYRDWEDHGLLQALLVANLIEDDRHSVAMGLMEDMADERRLASAQSA